MTGDLNYRESHPRNETTRAWEQTTGWSSSMKWVNSFITMPRALDMEQFSELASIITELVSRCGAQSLRARPIAGKLPARQFSPLQSRLRRAGGGYKPAPTSDSVWTMKPPTRSVSSPISSSFFQTCFQSFTGGEKGRRKFEVDLTVSWSEATKGQTSLTPTAITASRGVERVWEAPDLLRRWKWKRLDVETTLRGCCSYPNTLYPV